MEIKRKENVSFFFEFFFRKSPSQLIKQQERKMSSYLYSGAAIGISRLIWFRSAIFFFKNFYFLIIPFCAGHVRVSASRAHSHKR